MDWKYQQPVKIIFGNGKISALKEVIAELGEKDGILICSRSFRKSGLADKVIAEADGLLTAVYSDVSPNPEVTEVDACAKLMREQGSKFVVALGGGSVMDLAKAAATIATVDESIRFYHGTGEALPESFLPLIAVPTTSGTGSEVTSVSVLSDHETGKKAPIFSPNFFPAFAVVDPELTYTCPPTVTACSGIDVLCQAIEGYWSVNHQPICDALAIHAAKLVFEHLPVAYANPTDATAREKMAEASVIAGLAFALPKTTSSHAVSYPLTNIYGIPHGEACGLTIDYFANVNALLETDGRVTALAKALGFADAPAMAEAITALKKQIGLRTDLVELDLFDSQIDELVQLSHHPNLENNPVKITDDILYDLFGTLTKQEMYVEQP
ncbi:MAG TPA: iron-containing alcohol dehydrogenase family protein [Trichococcus sp.]|nr:iron-containing alcohol dehydrogenase family protein [Trichococcus sp.]